MDAVDACQEFFLSAVMTQFGMNSVDGEPTNWHHFPVGSQKLPPPERKQILLMATGSLIDKYIDLSYDSQPPKEADSDRVMAYAMEVMTLGMQFMEFIDAIRGGDGNAYAGAGDFSFSFSRQQAGRIIL